MWMTTASRSWICFTPCKSSEETALCYAGRTRVPRLRPASARSVLPPLRSEPALLGFGPGFAPLRRRFCRNYALLRWPHPPAAFTSSIRSAPLLLLSAPNPLALGFVAGLCAPAGARKKKVFGRLFQKAAGAWGSAPRRAPLGAKFSVIIQHRKGRRRAYPQRRMHRACKRAPLRLTWTSGQVNPQTLGIPIKSSFEQVNK